MEPEKSEADVFLVMALLLFIIGFAIEDPLNTVSWFSAGFLTSYSFLLRFGIVGNERNRK
tara:strand:- start:268 stop:447 length:180 start_codon:yes stop_codon:yes gene_type:complete